MPGPERQSVQGALKVLHCTVFIRSLKNVLRCIGRSMQLGSDLLAVKAFTRFGKVLRCFEHRLNNIHRASEGGRFAERAALRSTLRKRLPSSVPSFSSPLLSFYYEI